MVWLRCLEKKQGAYLNNLELETSLDLEVCLDLPISLSVYVPTISMDLNCKVHILYLNQSG